MNSIRLLHLSRRLVGLVRAPVAPALVLAARLLLSACHTVTTTQPVTVHLTPTPRSAVPTVTITPASAQPYKQLVQSP